MGLRCLLGHDFDEPETERERNEEGNEVVVTVREVKTCKRCGEKQVVSENKEITSIDQLRESATGEQPGTEPSTGVDAAESAADEWGTDELSPGRTDTPEADAGADDTTTAAGSESGPAAGAASTRADEQDDSIERGVADIIEQAEKDDDMLDGPAEESAAESATDEDAEHGATDAESASGDTEDGDVPVHPGQRGAEDEESEAPDAERDDGVILDEEAESPPEEARRQWEEEASPEEVPGQDPAVSEPEPEAPDGEDAEIIDGDAVSDQPSTEPESEPPEPASEPAESADDQQSTETHSAVESEDAEIMGAGPESPEPEPERRSDEPERPSGEAEPQSEPASPEREETEDGHMPWPDAPGEDDGHDATAPDGEPADVEFGGGLTPSDADVDAQDEESAPAEVEPSGSIDRIEDPEDDPATTEPDRANGHRTEDGESDDTSATPTANIDLERSTRDANMEYYCPECGLTRDVGNSSMRAGDICPDCRKGYITEQQKAE